MKPIIPFCTLLLLMLTTLFQLSCTDEKESTLPDVTATADTIHGIVKLKVVDSNNVTTLVDWHYGPAMVRAGNLANAALTSKGTFTLLLPKTIAGADFMRMSRYAGIQGGTCQATPGDACFVDSVQFIVDFAINNTAKSMEINLSKFALYNNRPVLSKTYFYHFYDRDGTFTGTSLFGSTFNWAFIKGWGMTETGVSSGTGYPVSSTSVDAAPADAIWTN